MEPDAVWYPRVLTHDSEGRVGRLPCPDDDQQVLDVGDTVVVGVAIAGGRATVAFAEGR